jgi:DtxR family Mn-dependent transcriptional regulator
MSGTDVVNPVLALVVFALLALVVAVVVWPRRGMAARLLRLARLTERARIEDALKRMYDAEYAQRPSTIESLAGTLHLKGIRTIQLVARLEALGLVHTERDHLVLTDAGRAEALRVLRSHRLWERYLADRTGVPAGAWHEEAEYREHTLSPDAVEQLASSMGHPRYDPHGDPIPTAAGEVPPHAGVALSALVPGQSASVVHLEDEPREVYEQLVRQGLAPGAQVEVREATRERIRFTADGEERTIEPVMAMNVTVVLPRDAEQSAGPYEALSALQQGEAATVIGIAPLCQGPQRRRLLDLGLVPGTVVTSELQGAFKDPVAYRVRGALIALRKDQADLVRVERTVAPVEAS